MSLLGALFGARSKDWPPEVMDAQDEALIRRDIGRLDEVRLGLGEQVGLPVDMVETGSIKNPFVLADINRAREIVYAS